MSVDEDAGVRSCVDVLDGYITELRSYMKRFPWAAGSAGSADPAAQEEVDEWEQLPTEVGVPQTFCIRQQDPVPMFGVRAAGGGPSVHPDQSDPQSSGRPAEEAAPGAAPGRSEDGGSAAGLLLPAAARRGHGQPAPR